MEYFNQIDFLKKELPKSYSPVFLYTGVFDRVVLTDFRKKILQLTKDDLQAQQKIFYVFVELAQNVSFYSSERDKESKRGKGSLIIGENDEIFFFSIGNAIINNALRVLEKKCEILNSLDKESLKELKSKQRNLIPGTNGGAHIGLIMVSLASRKKLHIKAKKINDDISFFSIKVEINKTKR